MSVINKMSVLQITEKYTCPVCGSKIKNSNANITKHNNTVKHQNALNNTPTDRKVLSTNDKQVKERERIRLYRLKKKQELGEENYKKIMREQKQNYRISKATVGNPTVDNLSNVAGIPATLVGRNSSRHKIENEKTAINNLVGDMDLTNLSNASAPKIEKSTLVQYAQNIGRIYSELSGKQWDGSLDWLYNINVIQAYIERKYKNTGTKLNYYKSINSFLKRQRGYEDLSKQYGELQNGVKNLVDIQRGRNKMSEREQQNMVDWSKIVSYNDPRWTDEDYLLFKLYTALPPRRLEAYSLLKFIKGKTTKQIQNLDKNFNYLIVNKNGNPTQIILNKYKTSKRYRTFTIHLTQPDQKPILRFSEIRDAVKRFMRATNIKNGDLVFPDIKGNVYGDFTRRVNSIFKGLGKNLSVDVLRHSFISFYANKKEISLNTIRMLTKYLGHSVSMFLEYRKFNDVKELSEKYAFLDNE